MGISTHNFVKNASKLKNKCLLHGKFYGGSHEKTFRFQTCDIWGLGPKNWFRVA